MSSKQMVNVSEGICFRLANVVSFLYKTKMISLAQGN